MQLFCHISYILINISEAIYMYAKYQIEDYKERKYNLFISSSFAGTPYIYRYLMTIQMNGNIFLFLRNENLQREVLIPVKLYLDRIKEAVPLKNTNGTLMCHLRDYIKYTSVLAKDYYEIGKLYLFDDTVYTLKKIINMPCEKDNTVMYYKFTAYHKKPQEKREKLYIPVETAGTFLPGIASENSVIFKMS